MATNAKTEGARTPVIDFPAQIQTALARIMGCDGGGLRDLSYRERSLLARLVRNVSIQDPTDSVRVSVSALAEALKTCNKTLRFVRKTILILSGHRIIQIKCLGIDCVMRQGFI